MSAIWGYITAGRNQLDPERVSLMEEAMSFYKLDRVDEVKLEDAYLGCGHQYITLESLQDVSPVYDPEQNMYFAGDCFLYNRPDVIAHLQKFPDYTKYMKDSCPEHLGDCQLAYIAYQLMKDDFVSLLRGAFTFAVYYVGERLLHLFTDHLSKRYLAYYADKDLICFGSTLKPIRACLKDQLHLNREFIIRGYRTMAPMMFYVPEMTVYEGVNQIVSATHLIIDCNEGILKDKISYWNPLDVKPLKGKTDEEYKELFLKTYRKIVTAQLRSIGETGIMLSGGLDSSSVAALAAPKLKEQGKKLFSYTSVPHPDYECTKNSPMMEDESALIKEQQKYHTNLCPRFVCGDASSDCVGTTDSYHRIFDIPVKPSINNLNIDNMSREAVRDNCKILLGAANGNATVSYGNIGPYISMSLQDGHPIRAFREMSAFCKRYQLSRKKYLKAWLKTLVKTLCKNPEEYSYFLKDCDMKKYHLEHFSRDKEKEFGTEFFVSHRQRNNFLYMPAQYIQRNFFYTNQGLYYGYLELDPTMTVEIIELCASLPLECFVHNGVERRLINGYMKDLLPPAITDIRKGFGRQAADSAFRVNRNWDKIKDSVYDILDEPLLREYMDEKELQNLIRTVHEKEYHLDYTTVVYVTLLSSLGYFLRDFSQNENREKI